MKILKQTLNILLFDYWQYKIIGICCAIFMFLLAFIIPNAIHNRINMNSGAWYIGNPFQGNWVAYGFKWLGIEIGCLIGIVILFLIVWVIVKGMKLLYKWSHK
jgi:hypothetical protein